MIPFVLSACIGSSQAKDSFALPLRIEASLEGSNALFAADIFEGGCDITFEGGHALEGTKLCFRTDGNSATVGDILTRDIKNGTFPAQEALIKAIRLLATTEISGVAVENGTRYTIDEMTIIVYHGENTDLPTGIETEEHGRRFEFSIASLEPYEAEDNGVHSP